MLLTILAFIFVFGMLVFVHELGHFLAAKWMGVSVKTFAFGFPPTLFSRKVGETVYRINAIPLGGYVSLLGEELENDDTSTKSEGQNPRSLLSKEPWQVILIMVSGVIMNVILAVLLFFICYVVGFQPIVEGASNFPGIKNDMRVKITDIEKDSPAAKSGLLPEDHILSVDGKVVSSDDKVVAIIAEKSDPATSKTTIEIQRGGEKLTKEVAAYQSKIKLANGAEQSVSRIGITLTNTGSVYGDIPASFGASLGMVWHVTVLTFEGIISLFRQLLFQFQISNQVSGPVGIVVMTNYFAQLGFVPLLQFAAVLSISLAIFNILPIPALDGGQIIVATTEVLARRKFSQKTKNTVQLIGFAFIISLFLIITVKDLLNFGIIKYITDWF